MERGTGAENTNGNKTENFKAYPQPLAKYTDVISDKELFMRTLEKFHAAMKTKFMIPIIGGRDLDLHQLFKEVTSRGGIEKVIGDRRWKEVTASFTFPSTATNASFILRKYYYSLLQHYEQLYFFGSQGSNSNTDNMPSPATPGSSKRPLETTFDSRNMSKKRNIKDEPPLLANQPVTGVIDGKFEHGYFVTVTIGSQTLRGVLYHVPEQPSLPLVVPPQPIIFNSGPAFSPGVSISRGFQPGSASGSPTLGVRRQRRRRKRRPSTMDPNHPKPNRSGYNFFFAEQHAQLKPLYPGKDREISRMIGERWNNLTETDKNVYQERGRVDKQRYQSEMVLYRERQKTDPGHVISDAVPINQRPGCASEFTVENVDLKVEEGDLVLANNNDQNGDSDGSDDSEDVDKNQDVDVDTGSVSGSDSESDTSLDATQVSVEYQSSNVVVPLIQTGTDGFELRKREAAVSLVEVQLKTGEELIKSVEGNGVEGDVKKGEGFNDQVECELKMGEGSNDLVEGGLKKGEDFNDPIRGDLKTIECFNEVVEGDLKMKTGEGFNDSTEGDAKTVEGLNDQVVGGIKTNGDFRNPVIGDVKMSEVFNNTVSYEVKTGEDFNNSAVGDITMEEGFSNAVNSDPLLAAEVRHEEKMVEDT